MPIGTAATTMATATSGDSFWVLLHVYATVRNPLENTSAVAYGHGSNNERICASLLRQRPPVPSNLYVSCADGTFGETPRVLSMVDDIILFHAYIGPAFPYPLPWKGDFFIYRSESDPSRRSLERLPHPGGMVGRDDPFGILPREGDGYTVAALVPSMSSVYDFELHLFDSETRIWSRKNLIVGSRQEEFKVDIPNNINQIFHHNTSTVITLGGTTMCWVDLWRGIVFCDMLSENHALTGVPLPLPLIYYSGDRCEILGPGRHHRGIAFLDGCARLVEVVSDYVGIAGETGFGCFRVESWTITAWYNNDVHNNSYDDWHVDITLKASNIILSDHSEKLPLGLQHLFVSDPTICMNNGDGYIVYLTAREKYTHPKSWIIAVDLKSHMVQSVVLSGPLPPPMPCIDTNYCTCSISKYCTGTSTVSGGT
ncbi:hypothetical protein ACQJBY_008979 [Aegilops geniculata]